LLDSLLQEIDVLPHILEMKDEKNDVSDEERNVMRECIREAFWYRALPLSLLTGFSVNYAIKVGKIKSTSRGAWPIVLGSSSLAYFIAKLSYVTGKECKNKFLTEAPSSEISDIIRKQRKENDLVEEDKDPKLKKFEEILDNVDVETLSESEKKIIQDCNNTRIWQYCLPMMMGMSGSAYLAMKKGLLRTSKWNSTLPMAPKIIVGGTLGYIIGNWIYLKSKDCSDRFIKFAPHGKIARILRYDDTLLSSEVFQENNVILDHENALEGYSIPEYDLETIEKHIRSNIE